MIYTIQYYIEGHVAERSTDVEYFRTLAACRRSFRWEYAHACSRLGHFPRYSEAMVWRGKLTATDGIEPDYVMRIGPRHGVIVIPY